MSDPAIGYLSDRTRRYPGGRKPWIIAGALVSMISLYFLFIPPEIVTPGYYFTWFLLAFLGWTLVEIPHMAWGSELTRNYKDRTTVFSYKAFFYYLGYMSFLALPFLPIFEGTEYTPDTLVAAFWVIVLVFPVTVLFAVRCCPQGEAVSSTIQKSMWFVVKSMRWNRPLLMLVVVFILFGFAIGMQTSVAYLHATSFLGLKTQAPYIYVIGFPLSIVGLPIWLKIANSIGKHYALAAGAFLSAIAFLCLGFMSPGPGIAWYYGTIFALIQLFQGAFIAIAPAMMGDIVDYGLLKTGEDHSGTYFALHTFINKSFQGLGGGAGFSIAAWYGFDPASSANPESVTLGLQLVMGYLPALIFVIGGVFALMSPITKQRHKQILDEIKDMRPSA